MRQPLRVAICPDYREEQWPSMDRVADELLRALADDLHERIQAESVLPLFQHRAARVMTGRLAANIDRGINRLLDYPAHVAAARRSFDVFHVIDHSYAQLVHRLPSQRTIVTCHDLDTFRSVLTPAAEPRSPAFRAMTRHILRGLAAAAVVTCDSDVVRRELIAARVLDPERLVVVPIGVNRVFTDRRSERADAAAERLVAEAGAPAGPGAVELLHVGSSVPRKRIDVLIEVLAALRPRLPAVRLVRVGGALTPQQHELAVARRVSDAIVTLPAVDDATLAALYRRAAMVLLPSEREGFGLPVVEALACGAPVLASNLPVLREVGGPTVAFVPAGDVPAWAQAVAALVAERVGRPDEWRARRERGRVWASRYSWSRFAGSMAALYEEVAAAAADRRGVDIVAARRRRERTPGHERRVA